MSVPDKISEHQKKLCEQIKKGVEKHLAQGLEKVYSDACPVRLWVSILRHHKEAPDMMRSFMREADTMGGKYMESFSFLLVSIHINSYRNRNAKRM